MTGKFTVCRGKLNNFFKMFIDWSHLTSSHTPKDSQRSPHNPAYTKLWDTGVRGPFIGGLFFTGIFYQETFFPETIFSGISFLGDFLSAYFFFQSTVFLFFPPRDFLSGNFFSKCSKCSKFDFVWSDLFPGFEFSSYDFETKNFLSYL